jgi:hypothetical protein
MSAEAGGLPGSGGRAVQQQRSARQPSASFDRGSPQAVVLSSPYGGHLTSSVRIASSKKHQVG